MICHEATQLGLVNISNCRMTLLRVKAKSNQERLAGSPNLGASRTYHRGGALFGYWLIRPPTRRATNPKNVTDTRAQTSVAEPSSPALSPEVCLKETTRRKARIVRNVAEVAIGSVLLGYESARRGRCKRGCYHAPIVAATYVLCLVRERHGACVATV